MAAADDRNEITGTLPVAGRDLVPVAGERGERREPPEWLTRVRAEVEGRGRHLTWQLDGAPVVVPLGPGLTRIGRSLQAEIRFDDATVSRRHALISVDDDGVRVIDDRSLNGIQVNGRRVESGPLQDGDEVLVGRHAIYLLDPARVEGPVAGAAHALAE